MTAKQTRVQVFTLPLEIKIQAHLTALVEEFFRKHVGKCVKTDNGKQF